MSLSLGWLFWVVCGPVAGVVVLGYLCLCRRGGSVAGVVVLWLFAASPCESSEEQYSDRYVHDHQTGYDKEQRGGAL